MREFAAQIQAISFWFVAAPAPPEFNESLLVVFCIALQHVRSPAEFHTGANLLTN